MSTTIQGELHFPHAIDNSMRKELVKCQKIAHWKFERGLNSPEPSIDLHAGGAFAKGCEEARKAYYQLGKTQEASVLIGVQALYAFYGDFKCPTKSNKSADRMAGALAYYLEERNFDFEKLKPFMLNGRLSVEMSFNHPIPITHPGTGKQLTYCGRFDMLAKDEAGQVWVCDEKTTSQMGEAWIHQWNLDSALTGYCWGSQKLLRDAGDDSPVVGAIINGVAIRALSNAMPYEHMRCPVFREDWEVERWYAQMLRDIEGWSIAYVSQDHNQVLDHACALYNNPCQFAKLCKARNPERLFDTYTVRFWNPLERDS